MTTQQSIQSSLASQRDYYMSLAAREELPTSHAQYLELMQSRYGFEPKVCYDIGANLLHWQKVAKRVWPCTQTVLFDAFNPLEFLYVESGDPYYMGVLSDTEDKVVKFYQNDKMTTGNSYYKENNDHIFPPDIFVEKRTRTLDSVVAEKSFPLPDLIKIDVQGAELDVLKGASKTLEHAQYLIVELQTANYNIGAPKANVSLPLIERMKAGKSRWKCISRKFSDNGPDADYCFKNMAWQSSCN